MVPDPMRQYVTSSERLPARILKLAFLLGLRVVRVSRSVRLAKGGPQERMLAAQYADDVHFLRDAWPRTGHLIQTIEKGYEAEARGENAEAEM
jgi:hypothetical protein